MRGSAAEFATSEGAEADADDLGGSVAGAATSGGAEADADDLGCSAVGAATLGTETSSGAVSWTGADFGADSRTGAGSWTGVGSGVDSRSGVGTDQYVAQTHRMATAITGSTEERGTVSVTTSAEALGMPAALAETSGGSSSLKRLWIAWVSSNATFTMLGNTEMASVMAEDCGLTSLMAGGFGVTVIL